MSSVRCIILVIYQCVLELCYKSNLVLTKNKNHKSSIIIMWVLCQFLDDTTIHLLFILRQGKHEMSSTRGHMKGTVYTLQNEQYAKKYKRNIW